MSDEGSDKAQRVIEVQKNPGNYLTVVQIGMNALGNALGQGNRANATIGRAIRLLLMNLGVPALERWVAASSRADRG